MRDKLYKTNKKVGYYRFRAFLIGILLIAGGAAALTIPYPYVAKAINEAQARRAQAEEAANVETPVSVEDVTN
ncbi:MAG: hypothetical protein BWX74_00138 [Tenericutes bacterium ADurb.Bin087]|nr:MAG: hypothetical protein BWX74_00138 [Tenericutes bacterium ADurb.Bin087]